jgi:hypothetical protein
MCALSKSKILAYRQCPLRLWLEIHQPTQCKIPAAKQILFKNGHNLDKVAQRIYDPHGRGTLIDRNPQHLASALSQTQQLLTQRRIIFEAGFQAGGVRFFADVLRPVLKGKNKRQEWRLVEVKSSTEIKDYHRDDVAFQAWVAKSSGLPLAGVSLAYIDKSWVYPGNDDYTGLLIEEDLTKEAFGRSQEVAQWVQDAQAIVSQQQPPSISMGDQCEHPYECSFIDYCRSQRPKTPHPVEWLPKSKTLKTYIQTNSIIDMSDVPDSIPGNQKKQIKLLSDRQKRVKTCTLSGQPYFNKAGAAKALEGHDCPAYFLDFETVAPAVPIWKGTRPYQQIPFQFSCHRLNRNGCVRHVEFLDTTGQDPSRPFIQALLRACGEQGPIFVYNASFEISRMRGLAERFPHYADALPALIDRVVDLLPIARNHYYHPDQAGSWSLKAVLPTIAPKLNYSRLTGVQDGNTATMAYLEAIAPETTRAREWEIRDRLLDYCKLDTKALIRLWKFFSGKTCKKTRTPAVRANAPDPTLTQE